MEDVLSWLSELIGFDTTAEGTDAGKCAEYIAGEMSRRNAIVKTFVTSGGPREAHHLLAEVRGGDPSSVILHAHLDTEDFGEEEGWLFPPDRASFRKGCVCGRGALDCKGQLAVWMKLIADAAEKPFPFTLRLLVTDLEEQGGEYGLGKLLEEHPEILDDAALVIGEGGGYPFPFRDSVFYTFQTAERDDYVETIPGEESLSPEVIGSILSAGIGKGYYSDDILDYASEYESLSGRRMELKPLYEGMESFFRDAPRCIVYREYGRLFEECLQKEVPGARLMPCITPGYSDNRFFRSAGVPVAGFFPLDINNSLGGIHGRNEYISEDSLDLACRLMSRILENLTLQRS